MLILALALLAQSPTIEDLDFTRAVEESVMAATDESPPDPFRMLIRTLGSEDYRCREAASRLLEAASKDDQRWLFWGRKYRDPEIRLRCNSIIRRLNPCPSCNGTGISKYNDASGCWDCAGWKTIWLWSPWD